MDIRLNVAETDFGAARLGWDERGPAASRPLGDLHFARLADAAGATPVGLDPRPMEDFPPIVDLGDLDPETGFAVNGDPQDSFAGLEVSSAGDVNGDGFDDMIFGAEGFFEYGPTPSEAYVVFGKAGGLGTVNLTALGPNDGFKIEGAGSGLRTVSDAGDINDDGFGDVIVGVPGNGTGQGAAYVLFGKASGFGTINLTALAPADGFVIAGAASSDLAGGAISSVGDVNGDGIDDFVIGASQADAGGANSGAAYVIFGKDVAPPSFADIDLANLTAADGFVIAGEAAGDGAGNSVSSAGDVNGDGFGDLIVGAPNSGVYAGKSYVLFGRDAQSDPFTTVDLGALAPDEGFAIQGSNNNDYAGSSVSSAGDINGDGFDDILVGAPGNDDAGQSAGEAYVIFGKAAPFADIDVSDLAVPDGFVIQGGADVDIAGASVSSAGDFNGDGFDDIIVGAPGNDAAGTDAGRAYLIFGKADGFGPIDLATFHPLDPNHDPLAGFILQGAGFENNAGDDVAAAGDIDGDGFDDIIIGGNAYSAGASDAYVVYGFATGAETIEGSAGNDMLVGGAEGEVLDGKGGDDTLQGNGGADTLDGGAGSDFADYSVAAVKVVADLKAPQLNTGDAAGDVYDSIENLRGSGFKDRLSGDDFNNRIEGLAKEDVLSGRKGDDTLAGGAGKDQLKGGAGADRFEFANIDGDRIFDFATGTDEIALDSAVFGLPEGALDPARFVIGNQALDANDRLIYKADSGKLFFDPDGNGAAAQVQIATLTGAPAIVAADFIVI